MSSNDIYDRRRRRTDRADDTMPRVIALGALLLFGLSVSTVTLKELVDRVSEAGETAGNSQAQIGLSSMHADFRQDLLI